MSVSSYWANMTPEQRKAEARRRAITRGINKAAKATKVKLNKKRTDCRCQVQKENS